MGAHPHQISIPFFIFRLSGKKKKEEEEEKKSEQCTWSCRHSGPTNLWKRQERGKRYEWWEKDVKWSSVVLIMQEQIIIRFQPLNQRKSQISLWFLSLWLLWLNFAKSHHRINNRRRTSKKKTYFCCTKLSPFFSFKYLPFVLLNYWNTGYFTWFFKFKLKTAGDKRFTHRHCFISRGHKT